MTTIPTIGFNVENVEHKHFCFNVWDLGGGDKSRPLWRHFFHDCHGIVFVADCENREIITDEDWDDLKTMVYFFFHFVPLFDDEFLHAVTRGRFKRCGDPGVGQ